MLKYDIGSVFKLPILYHDFLLNLMIDVFLFSGRVVDKLYF